MMGEFNRGLTVRGIGGKQPRNFSYHLLSLSSQVPSLLLLSIHQGQWPPPPLPCDASHHLMGRRQPSSPEKPSVSEPCPAAHVCHLFGG